MEYTVQILNDKEFESLPYDGLENSMGFADVKKGLAFVRSTGIKEIDLATLSHEVNHLIEKHGKDHPDYEKGILHKSKGNFFSQIFGGGGLGGILGDVAAVALAPFTGGASLGYLPLAAAAGGAIQNGIQGGNILGGALKGFGVGGLGAGVGGGLLGAAEGIGGGLGGIGSGLVSGATQGANTFISGIPGFGAGGSLNAATGLGGSSFGASAVPTGASSLAPSALSIPGNAAANAASATGISGGVSGSAPGIFGSSGSLLGNTTNAFNAATPVSSLVEPASSGLGGATGVSGFSNTAPFKLPDLNSVTPTQSLVGGGVGNSSGQPITLLGQPAQAGLPSTTVNPINGLPSTVAQQTPQSSAGITTALQNTGAGAGTTGATAAPKGFDFGNLVKGLTTGTGALGAGTALLGASQLGSTPQFQTPASLTSLENQVRGGGTATPLGSQAQSALSQLVATPPGALSPALQANDPYFQSTFSTIDQNFQNAKNQLDSAYNQVGQLGSGEYLDQLRQLTEATAQDKNQIVAQENQRRQELGQSEQMQNIQSALGVDQNTFNDLAGLTGLDVQIAAQQYGVNASDVQALRTQIASLGGNLVSKGLGITSSPSTTVNLLGVNTPATATA